MTEDRPEIIAPDAEGLARAGRLIADGALVAFPTETVYGLGADAGSDRAVAAIFDAKGRPRFNPLIVHLADPGAVARLCRVGPEAERLASAFWPGALTMVLPLRPDGPVSPLVTAGLSTLAVRVPDHPVARSLIAAAGRPVAAPSANPSGRISPTRAAHVVAGLGARVAAVVDGGNCAVGVESTILDLTGPPRLLRAGGLPAEILSQALGVPLAIGPDPARPTAPGQLASHYAPRASIRLQAEDRRPGEHLLGFASGGTADLDLSPGGDLVEAAANLFAHLHALDAMGAERIAVAPIPDRGLGRAINDRLARAAAPRP